MDHSRLNHTDPLNWLAAAHTANVRISPVQFASSKQPELLQKWFLQSAVWELLHALAMVCVEHVKCTGDKQTAYCTPFAALQLLCFAHHTLGHSDHWHCLQWKPDPLLTHSFRACVCLSCSVCLKSTGTQQIPAARRMGNQLTGIAPSQILPVEYYLTDVAGYDFDSRLALQNGKHLFPVWLVLTLRKKKLSLVKTFLKQWSV